MIICKTLEQFFQIDNLRMHKGTSSAACSVYGYDSTVPVLYLTYEIMFSTMESTPTNLKQHGVQLIQQMYTNL